MAKLQTGKAVEQQSMHWPFLTPSELKPSHPSFPAALILLYPGPQRQPAEALELRTNATPAFSSMCLQACPII